LKFYVVHLQESIEFLLDLFVVSAVLIYFGVYGFGFGRIRIHVISDKDGVLHGVLELGPKVVLNKFSDVLLHEISVLLGGEFIGKDPQTFVPPESDQLFGFVEIVDGGLAKPFIDSREIPQIKNVVEFNGSSGQQFHQGVIQFDRHLSYLLGEIQGLEFRQVGQVRR